MDPGLSFYSSCNNSWIASVGAMVSGTDTFNKEFFYRSHLLLGIHPAGDDAKVRSSIPRTDQRQVVLHVNFDISRYRAITADARAIVFGFSDWNYQEYNSGMIRGHAPRLVLPAIGLLASRSLLD